MSSGNDNAIWTFSQNFTTGFRTARSELETQFEKAKASPNSEAIQTLATGVAKLAKSLTDAAGSLPAYDQKLYETQLKALETGVNELRISIAPKPKFAFNKRKVVSSTPSSGPTVPVAKDAAPAPSPSAQSSNSSISSHTYKYITMTSLAAPLSSSDLTISDLDHCILNLLRTNEHHQQDISAIHLRKISNSILLLPIINGSILIHDLYRCVIVMGCHQFRMHSSVKVDVFLSISSNPVIEDCQNIRFAPYPPALLSSSSELPEVSSPIAVQDFSHIRNTPSPNWAHMDPLNTDRSWPIKALQSKLEIGDCLETILPL